MDFLKKISGGLKKTSENFSSGLENIFNKSRPAQDVIQELEDFMISSDISLSLTEKIINNIKNKKYASNELTKSNFLQTLKEEMLSILEPVESNIFEKTKSLQTILMCGVNGTGKTTTIGKLCKILKENNNNVIVGAADTFRAAAIEQLTIWGERANVPVVTTKQGGDAAGLAYDALQQAKTTGTDILMIDTAGRLQSNTDLMAELEKIIRVLRKIDPDVPHASLLILDATTGQNALMQAEVFQKSAETSGIIMTKLDGTARGGVLVAIAERLDLPIHYIGVGETAEDLLLFDPESYARALVGLEEIS